MSKPADPLPSDRELWALDRLPSLAKQAKQAQMRIDHAKEAEMVLAKERRERAAARKKEKEEKEKAAKKKLLEGHMSSAVMFLSQKQTKGLKVLQRVKKWQRKAQDLKHRSSGAPPLQHGCSCAPLCTFTGDPSAIQKHEKTCEKMCRLIKSNQWDRFMSLQLAKVHTIGFVAADKEDGSQDGLVKCGGPWRPCGSPPSTTTQWAPTPDFGRPKPAVSLQVLGGHASLASCRC